jgi:GR25 family glycosyltransferase involved in LPS biosynthesis
MDKSKDRWLNSWTQINREGIAPSGRLVSAIDGYNCPQIPWTECIEQEPNSKKYNKFMRDLMINEGTMVKSKYPLKCTEIGNIYSFVETFKKAIELGYEKIMVLEDDFKMVKNFDKKLNNIMTFAPTDADVLYLGISKLNYKYGSFEDIDNEYFEKPLGIDNEKYLQKYKVKGAIYGMFGFIINKKAMQKFINYAKPVSYPSDCILGRLATSNLIKSYALKKDHQLISYFNMKSTIGNR